MATVRRRFHAFEDIRLPKKLWLCLVLPLAGLTVISLFLHTKVPADGLFINVATELLGIVVTVAYVDWVFKTHERSRWRGTSSRVDARLRTLATAAVSGLRSTLGFGIDILDESVLRKNDPRLASTEVMRVGVHVLAPSLRTRLGILDTKGWKTLAEHVQSVWREAERLQDQFGRHLEPAEQEVLLDMQQALDSSLILWRTFPDVVGVTDDDLPDTGLDPVGLREAAYDLAAEELRKVLNLSNTLVQHCNDRAAYK